MGGRDGSLRKLRQHMHKKHAQNLKKHSAAMAENPENVNTEGVRLCSF